MKIRMRHFPLVLNLVLFIFLSNSPFFEAAPIVKVKIKEGKSKEANVEEPGSENPATQPPTNAAFWQMRAPISSRKRKISLVDSHEIKFISPNYTGLNDYFENLAVEYTGGVVDTSSGKIPLIKDELHVLDRINSFGIKVIADKSDQTYVKLTYHLPLNAENDVEPEAAESEVSINQEVVINEASAEKSEKYHIFCFSNLESFGNLYVQHLTFPESTGRAKLMSQMTKMLFYHLNRGDLMSAGVMLQKFPKLIKTLDAKAFSELIFFKTCRRKLFKNFIFDLAPRYFIKVFLEVYSVSDPQRQHLLIEDLKSVLFNWKLVLDEDGFQLVKEETFADQAMLKSNLIETKSFDSDSDSSDEFNDEIENEDQVSHLEEILNETRPINNRKEKETAIFKSMFNYLLAAKVPWPILSVFIHSHRPLDFSKETLFSALKKSLCDFKTLKAIFKSVPSKKTRVQAKGKLPRFKKFIPSRKLIRQTIKVVISSHDKNWVALFRRMLNDDFIISNLKDKVCLGILKSLISNKIQNIRYILDLKIIDRVKENEMFVNLLDQAFQSQEREFINALLLARSPSSKFPLFTSKHIRDIAANAILNGDNFALKVLIDAFFINALTSLRIGSTDTCFISAIFFSNNVEIAKYLGPFPIQMKEDFMRAQMTPEMREALVFVNPVKCSEIIRFSEEPSEMKETAETVESIESKEIEELGDSFTLIQDEIAALDEREVVVEDEVETIDGHGRLAVTYESPNFIGAIHETSPNHENSNHPDREISIKLFES